MSLKSAICAVTIALIGIVVCARATDLPAEPVRSEKSTDPIQQLIAQLGSDDFSQRRDAEAALIQLGAAAFDYLQAARSDPDLEIATQSQYLLYRVPIDWVRPDDPQEVRDLMVNYAGVNVRERRDIIKDLAGLSDGQGLAALSRIAHYDMSQITAKFAALSVLYGFETYAESAPTSAEIIRAEIGSSPRDSARWLRLCAAQLDDLKEVNATWASLIAEEAAQFGSEQRFSNSRLLLGLLQFHVNLCQNTGNDQVLFEALKGKLDFLNSQSQMPDVSGTRVISRMLDKDDLSPLSESSLRSRWIEHDALLGHILTTQRSDLAANLALTISWILENHEWGVLSLLEQDYEEQIKGDRLLLYLIAVARAAADRPEDAVGMAKRAFELVAVDLDDRNELGEVIAELGYHDWAEQEWNYVISQVPVTSIDSMKARRSIANWCLHDRGEDQAAADLLGEVCDAADGKTKESAEGESPEIARLNETAKLYLKTLRTQREYFLACHLESQGDFEGQQKHLEAAYQLDHEDPDVLIAMFRLQESDDKYRDRVAGRIRRAVDVVEQRIESDSEEPMWYNHFAWLVSNTQGDFDKAVRYSLKSLELCPNTPSYLDTLGRCYYAAGDLENAVKYQRQAVAMHPRVQVMQRQLEMFEQALAEKSK